MHQSDNFLKLKYLVLVRVWGNRHLQIQGKNINWNDLCERQFGNKSLKNTYTHYGYST